MQIKHSASQEEEEKKEKEASEEVKEPVNPYLEDLANPYKQQSPTKTQQETPSPKKVVATQQPKPNLQSNNNSAQSNGNGNPWHTKNLLEVENKFVAYVLSKLAGDELKMARGE